MTPESSILETHKVHLERIDEELDKVLSSRVPLIREMGSHSLLGRGKRLRPLLFVLSCRLCGYQGEDIYRLSTIFEYIHAASLLHDDVLDNADLRRKRPSANRVWGNHAAVLEGDFLFAKCCALAVSSKSLAFLQRITETTLQMAEGQIMEFVHTHDWSITKEQYVDIITAKTASLIATSCACGAIIAKGGGQMEDALSQFGWNAGIAFQLIDDLLDYDSSESALGKPVGKDLKEGKITLPLIYTLCDLEGKERERLERLFRGGSITEQDYSDLVARVRRSGSLERIREEAKVFSRQARDSLTPFPDSPLKRHLLHLSEFILDREF